MLLCNFGLSIYIVVAVNAKSQSEHKVTDMIAELNDMDIIIATLLVKKLV